MSTAGQHQQASLEALIDSGHFKQAAQQGQMAADTDAHHQQPSKMEQLEGKAHVLAGKALKEPDQVVQGEALLNGAGGESAMHKREQYNEQRGMGHLNPKAESSDVGKGTGANPI